MPLNPWASPQENLDKIRASEISVILCTSDQQRTLQDFLRQNGLSGLRVIEIESKQCAEYDAAYAPPAAHTPLEKDEILLLFTQGTMGKQKGCFFNHAAVIQAMMSVKMAYRALPTDVFYCQEHYSTAFRWIHSLMAPLLAGAGVLISDERDPKNVLELITEFRVTHLAPDLKLFPGLLKFAEQEKLSLPTGKAVVYPGTLPEAETWERLKRMSRASVFTVYGLAEYLGSIAMSTAEAPTDPKNPGFVGPAVMGAKIRVVDDNHDEIDKKKPQRGQLCVTGPQLMTRYLNQPEEQKHAIRGTWLFTGDFVEIDKSGNAIYLDRQADLVGLPTGEKIQPRRIEAFVRTLGGVEDAAYLNVRDRRKQPTVALVIERKPQASLNEKQIQDFVAGKLVKGMAPSAIFFVDVMPRTVTGAINRERLRHQFDGAV